ncbi:MAG: peptidoglycan D,D-transpeptidase FtsI family protein [Ilumatobacteraceae bacterium]
MNRKIRQLAVALIACYVTLFAALNYWQVQREEQLSAEPDNTRQLLRDFDKPRGPIVTADGVIVAHSVPAEADSDVKFTRRYPTGDLFANVVGYHTFALGSTQVERTKTEILTGSTAAQQLRAIPALLGGDPDTSGSIQLTLNHDLQNIAKFLLAQREGSIVVLETATGAVKVMWSYPTFDPNLIANPDYDAAFTALTELQNDPRDPLLANAYQQRYMPGSTFKVLTTGVALDDGVINLDSFWPDEREFVPPQTTDPIENYGGSVCGGDLAEVFARSCNTPFARTAVELGPERFVEGMKRWGIGETIPIDLPRAAASTIGETENLDQNLPLLAMRGFGQNEDQLVPIHMAMVAGAVANGGLMMKPYVVDAELDHQGRVLHRTEPEVWKTPITPGTAATLTQLMIGVAQRGTASCCIALEGGIPVAAKTGTAQLNAAGEPERSHLWITAFAPADAPKYVVAVMLKGTTEEISAGTGGRFAGPIAKAMLDAVFAADAADAAADAAAATPPPTEPPTQPPTQPSGPPTSDGAGG